MSGKSGVKSDPKTLAYNRESWDQAVAEGHMATCGRVQGDMAEYIATLAVKPG